MRLDLPQPRTAMTTVFIVMQPQSGMVLAKSFYRICGTLVGLVVMLVADQPVLAAARELFITATALWVGICTAGAARNRNFRSYGFVLAGYTAALIGIPAVAASRRRVPVGAHAREPKSRSASCARARSARCVFPQHAGEQMQARRCARRFSGVRRLRVRRRCPARSTVRRSRRPTRASSRISSASRRRAASPYSRARKRACEAAGSRA